ncbi:MAG: hypothetical protein AAB526_02460 [Patescibacteria group bacterium]
MKKIKIITFGFIFVSVFFIYSHPTFAATEDIISWAWSENIGWISFNCKNKIIGFENENGHCQEKNGNYGVQIDTETGKLSGYAWSENIGWISFEPQGPYPADPQNQATFNVKKICSSNDEEKKITGWAKVINTGNWIKMSGTTKNGNYGVKWNGDSFDDYAWSEDFGWIRFSGSAEGDSFYKTTINNYTSYKKPSASIPEEVKTNLCENNWGLSPIISLVWEFSDCDGKGLQKSYQVQVATDEKFENLTFNTAEKKGDDQAIKIGTDILQYDKPYFWRVKVQNNSEIWSEWTSAKNFTTSKHPYPLVDLKCSRQKDGSYVKCETLKVSAGENIYFKVADKEICGGLSSTDFNKSVELQATCDKVTIAERKISLGTNCGNNNCLSGESCVEGICTKTFTDKATGDKFLFSRTYQLGNVSTLAMSLEDSNGYSCETSAVRFKGDKINFPLPIWKEVIPKD